MDIDTIDTELRAVLHEIVADGETQAASDAVTGVRGRVARRRRSRRVAIGTSALTMAIVVAVWGVVLTRRSGHRSRVQVVSPSTVAAPAHVPIVTDPSGIESFGTVPLSNRSGTANVWTGTELVVWGGSIEPQNVGLTGPDQQFGDGAAFDPRTRKWRALTPSPLPVDRTTPVGVATDAGVVIARGRATALWEPGTNTWRALADAPAAVDDLEYTGSEVISASAHAILDPRVGTWRAVPPPPALDRKAVVWTGGELFVIGGPGTPFTSAVAYAYDPTANSWRRLSDPPKELHAEALAADWDGTRIVVVNYDMRALSYDPSTNTWTALSPVPARFSEWSPQLRASGGDSAVFMAQTLAVLDAHDHWKPLPYGAVPSLGMVAGTRIGTGDAGDAGVLFVLGRAEGTKVNVLTAIDPGRLVASADRLQVGIASVRTPAGYTLGPTGFDGTGTLTQNVRVKLTDPVGRTCDLTSTYGNPRAIEAQPAQEVLTNDGMQTPWHRDAPGRSWQFSVNGTDTLTITCTDPTAAQALAASASFAFR